MTPQEVSQKIVAACNCSGYKDLTMASFKSDDHTLSEALIQFGELARDFTFADWVALCRCYSKSFIYGDEICAYSDLGSILNLVKGYHETISATLQEAVDTLYDTVMNLVIDSTMITPELYGSGLAVFNPVLSDPMMALYTYGAGSRLDYYATDIGMTAWGEFQYNLSKIADECSNYIVDKSGDLTFTDFTYYYEDGEVKVAYDLGAFSGNGATYEGLYLDHDAYFDITLTRPGVEGDAIVFTADNPDAEITVTLVQYGLLGPTIRRVSENGVLPLDGVDYGLAGVDSTYTLVISSTEETTCTMSFVADWSNGVDYFDYVRTGSISKLAAGNNSIDKATQLPNGNYGGLLTCAGDKDYYKILSVYANTVNVTVKGTGLVVQEFNERGELLQTAAEKDGLYKFTVAKDNYVCVEGTADISLDECNSYKLSISDAAQTYLKAELNAMLPEKPVVTGELLNNQVAISVDVEDGLEVFYSKDMYSWRPYEDGLIATENECYYFRAVNVETGLESQYALLRVVDIDHEPPTVGNVSADVTALTNTDVIVTAVFSDNKALASSLYRIGEDGDWLDYDAGTGVVVTENATVFFKAVDMAGNESEIVSYEVGNIDTTKPVIELSGDNVTPLQASTLSASTEPGLDIFYSTDNATWTKYEGQLDVTSNATYYFKATDAAGNVGMAEYVFGNIDTTKPVKPVASADITWLTDKDVTVTAEFSADSVKKEYSLDGGATWQDYDVNGIIIIINGTVVDFRGIDAAGNISDVESVTVSNIDKFAPSVPSGLNAVVVDQTVTLSWTASMDDLAGVKEYTVVYSHDGQEFTLTTAGTLLVLENVDYATWQWSVLAVDNVGNVSDAASGEAFTVEQTEILSGYCFFPGRFAGGAKSMLAAQAKGGNRVSMYTEGAGWGTGLTLDPGWRIAGVGDFDADGRDDFLRLNDEGFVVGEMTQADGTFAAQVLNFKNAGWSILGTGDFNGNGSDDVLIANPTAASETVGLLGYWESGVTWTLINGYSAEWEMISTGDFDGDGKCDMLWRNEFVGEGGLTYNAFCTWIVEDPVDWRMVSVANPAEWNFLCAGDFNGNGMNDIAMINTVGVVGIWGVEDGYLSSWSILSAVDTSAWTLAGVADFNGDGTDDIAWSNNDTGLTGYWQINDKQLTTWANIATV